MITVYKKKAIPKKMDSIDTNDIFFNKMTAERIDERAKPIIAEIDCSELLDQYHIKSRFENIMLNIDTISTGCKTVLNIMYHPDKVFNIAECGENALDVIYALPEGNVFCSYPLISFDMKEVIGCDKTGKKIFTSYDELKEWWTNED